MDKNAKKTTFINSNKHILAEYDEKICFEDRAEFQPLWPYSFCNGLFKKNQNVCTAKIAVSVDLLERIRWIQLYQS